MLRPFFALVTTWNAYRLLRQDKLLNEMDGDTVAKWAACIPIWKANIQTFNVSLHRSWMRNIYRHGHLLTDDPDFWKRLQRSIQRRSVYDLESGMAQAGHFNNPLPFLYFEPYEEERTNAFGRKQTVTGEIQYMRATVLHGTHPQLGRKLRALGMMADSGDMGLFNLPVRGEDVGFGVRRKNSENYWRFFLGEEDFSIERIIDYYKSMLDLKPSETVYASWAHAAWQARQDNPALQQGHHWDAFENEIRPLFEEHIDWPLIAACHGFALSEDNARNRAIAAYAREQQEKDPTAQLMPPPSITHGASVDGVALAMLNVAQPQDPWCIYMLFAKIVDSEYAPESYSFDFS